MPCIIYNRDGYKETGVNSKEKIADVNDVIKQEH